MGHLILLASNNVLPLKSHGTSGTMFFKHNPFQFFSLALGPMGHLILLASSNVLPLKSHGTSGTMFFKHNPFQFFLIAYETNETLDFTHKQ